MQEAGGPKHGLPWQHIRSPVAAAGTHLPHIVFRRRSIASAGLSVLALAAAQACT